MTRPQRADDGTTLVQILADAVLYADRLEVHRWLGDQGLAPVDEEVLHHALKGRLTRGGGRSFAQLDRIFGVLPVTAVGTAWRVDHDGGRWAVVQGVVDRSAYGAQGPLIDLLAWHPREPDRMRLMLNEAVWLGDPPWLPDRAYLVRNAKRWLATDEQWRATVVLDWSPVPVAELRACSPLRVDDVDIKRLVETQWRDSLPRVELAA